TILIRTNNKLCRMFMIFMIIASNIILQSTITILNTNKPPTTSQKNACINNLRQIDGAEQQWALETKQAAAAVPAYTDISSYMRNAVVCPAGGAAATFGSSYTLTPVGGPTKPVCQIAAINHIL